MMMIQWNCSYCSGSFIDLREEVLLLQIDAIDHQCTKHANYEQGYCKLAVIMIVITAAATTTVDTSHQMEP